MNVPARPLPLRAAAEAAREAIQKRAETFEYRACRWY